MSERVIITIDEHVANVVLNRADKLNALDLEMFEALSAAADRIADEVGVRAVVLSGAGGNFCAGIDLSVLADTSFDIGSSLATPMKPSPANFFQKTAYAWRELSVPVICAIEGVAFGGGLQVALGADIRFATADAKFSIMESTWGIIPDMGMTATLRDLVAPDRVKELAWSARVIDGNEARDIGMITDVVADPLQAARALAVSCSAVSPDAVRGIKALVNAAWQLSESEALALEARLQSGIIGGANQREAVAAKLAKRKPDFNDEGAR